MAHGRYSGYLPDRAAQKKQKAWMRSMPFKCLLINLTIYSASFLAAALRGGAFFAVTSFAGSFAAAFFAGLAAFSALGAAAFFTKVCGLELPYDPLNLLPFAVRLSPLPMIDLSFYD
jgi:hypothetical protein